MAWINEEDVATFLGIEVPEGGDAYLTQVTAAAISWAQDRRAQAGYNDDPDEVPSARVKQGCVLLAGALYREQGSVDSFQSYQDVPFSAPVGSYGQVVKMLGIPRPAIG